MLVDDDPGLRALLRATFEVVDMEVAEAGSAEEAAAHVEGDHPDVVVLDVKMPGQGGLAYCRELKESPATFRYPSRSPHRIGRLRRHRLAGMSAPTPSC